MNTSVSVHIALFPAIHGSVHPSNPSNHQRHDFSSLCVNAANHRCGKHYHDINHDFSLVLMFVVIFVMLGALFAAALGIGNSFQKKEEPESRLNQSNIDLLDSYYIPPPDKDKRYK